MQAEYQSTDSDVSVLDDLNAANISKLAGSVLSSFAIAAGTGGLGAAPQAIAIGGQIFGNTYEQAKEAGLTPEQAAAFAIIPTLVGAKLAPYGVESVAAKLLNPSSKAALKEAIKSVGKQGGAKKALELGKEWAKNVLIEGTTGATEAAVQYGEEVAFQQLPNVDFGNDETLQGFARAIQEGFATEAAGGGALGLFLTVAPRKKLSDIASSAIKDPAKETKFFDDLKSLLDNNDINQQQFDAVSDFYQKAKAAAAQVPPTVTNPQQSARATELIQEQQELQAQIEQTNPAMVAPLQSRLDEVNAELGDIAEGKEAPAAAPAEAPAEQGIPLGTAASQALISKGEKLGFTKEQVNSMTAEERDVVRTASSKDDVKDLADKYAEQVGIEAEGKAKKTEEPTKEQQLKDVQAGNVATFTYETEKDVPDVFKDKISSTGEINGKPYVRVTVAKSLADYELSRQQAARAAEQQPTAPEIPAITAADFEATDKTNKAGRKARQKIREQYGTETAAKMEYITKNFEEAITNLEKQGKIRKICP